MRIALDAMGGDFAPGPNIDGAIVALKANPDLEILLVGDGLRWNRRCDSRATQAIGSRSWLAEGSVGMEEKPTDALRKKPNCSIAVCWQMMAGQKVDAVVSAGNTGAVVAAGLRTRLFLKGVKRPGIAVALPTLKGQSVLMDVGANPGSPSRASLSVRRHGRDLRPRNAGHRQPAHRADEHRQRGRQRERPVPRDARAVRPSSPLKDCYVGNVEGRGLYQGEADVIVCEGFVGNVVLKVSEGMADFMMQSVAREVLRQLQADRRAARKRLSAQSAKRYQHNEAGGAPLLGIDGICIICHGSSDARSITNALRVATTFKNRRVNRQIVSELAEVAVT